MFSYKRFRVYSEYDDISILRQYEWPLMYDIQIAKKEQYTATYQNRKFNAAFEEENTKL